MESAMQELLQNPSEANMKSITAPAQLRPSAPDQSQRRRATILVIEDERFVCAITCETLRAAGYRVLAAECAAAAKEKFLRYRKRIHLLLCDVVLPDSSGVLLSQAFRRLSPGLKVILASGYPCERAVELNHESRTEFLAKPYGAASLISKVQLALQTECSSGPAT
jgi:two-component system cell cycle sensor histidine kinase/response regulator CckA